MPLELALQTPDFGITLPQLAVFLLTIVLIFSDAFLPKALHYVWLTAISIGGYVLAMLLLFTQDGQNSATFAGVFRADGLTVFLSLVILIAAILTIMISANFVQNLESIEGSDRTAPTLPGGVPVGEFYLLIAFSVLGAMLVAAAGDLILIFVGIELVSLATYVLTAFAKRRATALEGAMKYFLLGIFATAILIYGMAWIYGVTGTTNLDGIAASLQASTAGVEFLDPALLLGVLLVIVGIGFKMALVPFHFWTPDAYDGAPTPVTAYMSVVPKVAAFAAGIRILVQGLGPLREDWTTILAVLAFVTIIFGNVVAISQRNIKRMLAYSSIAHTGYILVGLAAYSSIGTFGAGPDDVGVSSVLFYIFAYNVMNIGAFAIVVWLQHRGRGITLDDFSGLASTNPLAAISMTIFMVSLMGIPPLIGFYAKYYVILAAIEANMIWLAITVVVASAVSAFFYLRVVAVMYFNEPDREIRSVETPLLNAGIAGMAIGTIVLGLFSGPIINLADRWTGALTIGAQLAASVP